MHEIAHDVGAVKSLYSSTRMYLPSRPRAAKAKWSHYEFTVLMHTVRCRIKKALRLSVRQNRLAFIEHFCVGII